MKKQKICIGVFLLICSIAFVGCGSSDKAEESSVADAEIVAEDTSGEDVVAEENEEDSEETIATGLIFDIPSGMVADENMPGYYASENYADDYASIYYQEATYDDRYSLLTEDTIAELMQAMYSETYGIETIIDVKAFHRINLDGYEAYYLEIEYSVDDVVIESMEYSIISGEKIYSVTYTQKQDSGWHVKFEQSVNSLQVRQ